MTWLGMRQAENEGKQEVKRLGFCESLIETDSYPHIID